MRPWLFSAILISTGAGCNRTDVDGLGRIGHKLVDRAQDAVLPLRVKFDHTLKELGGAAALKVRVQRRLQWDKALADATIDVAVTENDVELKGILKTAEQRRRAVELAESTLGVGRVTDRLQVD